MAALLVARYGKSPHQQARHLAGRSALEQIRGSIEQSVELRPGFLIERKPTPISEDPFRRARRDLQHEVGFGLIEGSGSPPDQVPLLGRHAHVEALVSQVTLWLVCGM